MRSEGGRRGDMTTMRVVEDPSPWNGRRLPLRALAALLLLALSGLFLLAACGGDDEESTATPGGTRAPATTQTPAGTQSAGATQTPAPAATATTAPQASGGEIDPCELVTQADAEEVLGVSLGEQERQTVGPFETCIYGDVTGNYVQMQVGSDVYTQSTFGDAMEAAAEQIDIEAEPVSGLGDGAYWLAGVLWVQKGDVSLNVLVQTPELTELRLQGDTEAEQQKSLALSTDLARKALEGLR